MRERHSCCWCDGATRAAREDESRRAAREAGAQRSWRAAFSLRRGRREDEYREAPV